MERFAVIGLGRFGMRLASLLAETGAEVIAIDRSKDLVDAARDRVARAVCLNSTDAEALRAQGVETVDVAVVGIGSAFEDAALTTVILKQLGVKHVISRATTRMRGQILSAIGADEIVNPEREAAERWRSRLLAPAVIERIELAEGFGLAQVAAPRSFFGKTLQQLDVRKKFGVNVVAIRRTAESQEPAGPAEPAAPRQFIISVPLPDTEIKSGDILLLIGTDAAMEAFPTD